MIIPTIDLEQRLWQQGYVHVAGVDEAGRGPLAGPLTAGAVIIHNATQVVASVRDSKLMTTKQREQAFEEIRIRSSSYGISIIDTEELDNIGIQQAVKKAMTEAIRQAQKKLGEKVSFVIVDGSKTSPLEEFPSKRILKGGLYHYSIAAGSILAKVTRDRIMHELAKKYPQYKFENHVGYGTKLHMYLLQKHGPCPIHRKSYEPIKSMM